MEHGRLTELGSHEQLLAQGGTYSRLYQLQFGEAVEMPGFEGTA
jgi:ABC-type multidrug transport system fused ATPase/permease subunit